MFKKIFAILIAALMVITTLSLTAFAVEDESPEVGDDDSIVTEAPEDEDNDADADVDTEPNEDEESEDGEAEDVEGEDENGEVEDENGSPELDPEESDDSAESDDDNPETGLAFAAIPAVVALGAVAVTKKR